MQLLKISDCCKAADRNKLMLRGPNRLAYPLKREWGSGDIKMRISLPSELRDLILPGHQSSLIKRRRSEVILSRVQTVAIVFAILTPLWIPIDMIIFEPELAAGLTMLRVLSATAFAALALSLRRAEGIQRARTALFLLLAVPTVFFLVTLPLLGRFEVTEQPAQFVATGYAFLPFVMVAGLSMFPITALEGVLLSFPLWMVSLVVPFFGYQLLPFASHLGALWLLALLAAVASLSSMSQLHFLAATMTQSSHDGLTRAYNRQVGQELLDIQFTQSARSKTPLAILYIDLDDFKSINDRFGHEAGDKTLRDVADALRGVLRRGDILIRWGGEEFLVVLAQAGADGAAIAVERLRHGGLALRPDGKLQTASIGIAERIVDDCDDWARLVAIADRRMYEAKQGGKDRAVGPKELTAAGLSR